MNDIKKIYLTFCRWLKRSCRTQWLFLNVALYRAALQTKQQNLGFKYNQKATLWGFKNIEARSFSKLSAYHEKQQQLINAKPVCLIFKT